MPVTSDEVEFTVTAQGDSCLISELESHIESFGGGREDIDVSVEDADVR